MEKRILVIHIQIKSNKLLKRLKEKYINKQKSLCKPNALKLEKRETSGNQKSIQVETI